MHVSLVKDETLRLHRTSLDALIHQPTMHTHTHTHTHETETYAELRDWSVDHYDQFWGKFFHYSDIKYSKPYDEVTTNLGPFHYINCVCY